MEQSISIRCNRSNNNSPRISDLSFGTIDVNRSSNNSPQISDLSFGTIDVIDLIILLKSRIYPLEQSMSIRCNRSNNNFPRISDLSFGTIDVNPMQSIQQQFSSNLGFILWNDRCESIQQQFSILESLIYGKKKKKGMNFTLPSGYRRGLARSAWKRGG